MKKRYWYILMLALPYVLTVFLPILSIFCLVGVVNNDYHERIIRDKQNNVESAFDRFVEKMDSIESLSYMITENETISQYVYKSLRGAECSVIDNMEISQILDNYLINSEVEMMYLYIPGDNRIITPQAVFSESLVFFRFVYQPEGCTAEESVEQLKTLSWENGINVARKVKIKSREAEVIEFRLPVPVTRVKSKQAQLVMVLEVKNVLRDLFDILDEGAELYLYDGRGQRIYHSGEQYEMLIEDAGITDMGTLEEVDRALYGMMCSSADKSWKMKVYIPGLIQNGDADTTTQYAWLLMSVSLVASIVFCTYFTFRNHREIQEILALFRGQKNIVDKKNGYQNAHGYNVIKEYASELVTENNMIKERIPRLEYSHKYEILDKLIRNTYENQEEAERTFCNEDFDFWTGKCVVLCIAYKGSSYRTFVYGDVTIKDYTKGLLSEIIERKFELFDTSSRETICVLSMDDMDLEVVAENIISRLNVEIAYNYKIEVEIGVGNIVDSIYQISESYMQAKIVLRYRESSGKNVHLYSELVQLDDVYYYPKEYDEKIYNYVVAGKEAEAKEIIQKIYRKNFEENDMILSSSAVDTIKGRLKDVLILLAGKYDIGCNDLVEAKLTELNSDQSVMSFFRLVNEIIDTVAGNIVNKKKDVQQHTALKIMQYINDNYCDNMLSLKQISFALGLHENYISNLFSSKYGEPVSVVIESKRIEKACRLIKNTDMKISNVAQAVGYSSDASFRRAFKKIMGVSPGDYRG